MNDKLTGLDESFAAHRTFVGSLAGMNSHVPMKLSAVLKSSTANLTFVRSLLCVDASMNLQILFYAKHFVTEFALERSFASMRSIMTNLRKTEKRALF